MATTYRPSYAPTWPGWDAAHALHRLFSENHAVGHTRTWDPHGRAVTLGGTSIGIHLSRHNGSNSSDPNRVAHQMRDQIASHILRFLTSHFPFAAFPWQGGCAVVQPSHIDALWSRFMSAPLPSLLVGVDVDLLGLAQFDPAVAAILVDDPRTAFTEALTEATKMWLAQQYFEPCRVGRWLRVGADPSNPLDFVEGFESPAAFPPPTGGSQVSAALHTAFSVLLSSPCTACASQTALPADPSNHPAADTQQCSRRCRHCEHRWGALESFFLSSPSSLSTIEVFATLASLPSALHARWSWCPCPLASARETPSAPLHARIGSAVATVTGAPQAPLTHLPLLCKCGLYRPHGRASSFTAPPVTGTWVRLVGTVQSVRLPASPHGPDGRPPLPTVEVLPLFSTFLSELGPGVHQHREGRWTVVGSSASGGSMPLWAASDVAIEVNLTLQCARHCVHCRQQLHAWGPTTADGGACAAASLLRSVCVVGEVVDVIGFADATMELPVAHGESSTVDPGGHSSSFTVPSESIGASADSSAVMHALSARVSSDAVAQCPPLAVGPEFTGARRTKIVVIATSITVGRSAPGLPESRWRASCIAADHSWGASAESLGKAGHASDFPEVLGAPPRTAFGSVSPCRSLGGKRPREADPDATGNTMEQEYREALFAWSCIALAAGQSDTFSPMEQHNSDRRSDCSSDPVQRGERAVVDATGIMCSDLLGMARIASLPLGLWAVLGVYLQSAALPGGTLSVACIASQADRRVVDAFLSDLGRLTGIVVTLQRGMESGMLPTYRSPPKGTSRGTLERPHSVSAVCRGYRGDLRSGFHRPQRGRGSSSVASWRGGGVGSGWQPFCARSLTPPLAHKAEAHEEVRAGWVNVAHRRALFCPMLHTLSRAALKLLSSGVVLQPQKHLIMHPPQQLSAPPPPNLRESVGVEFLEGSWNITEASALGPSALRAAASDGGEPSPQWEFGSGVYTVTREGGEKVICLGETAAWLCVAPHADGDKLVWQSVSRCDLILDIDVAARRQWRVISEAHTLQTGEWPAWLGAGNETQTVPSRALARMACQRVFIPYSTSCLRSSHSPFRVGAVFCPSLEVREAPELSPQAAEVLQSYFVAAKAMHPAGVDANVMSSLARIARGHACLRLQFAALRPSVATAPITADAHPQAGLVDAVVALALLDASLQYRCGTSLLGLSFFDAVEKEAGAFSFVEFVGALRHHLCGAVELAAEVEPSATIP